MSKSLKKLIDINRLREFKNKLVGTGSPYVQTAAVDQTVAGTKTFSKPIVGSVTGSSGSCTGNAATATTATTAKSCTGNAATATNATYANWLRTSSHSDHLFHTEWDKAGYFWTYVTTGSGEYRAVRVARSDSAATATKLATARTIALSGAATGTATGFDGSGNITIPVTSLDASKLTGTASVSTTGNAATATQFSANATVALTGDATGTSAGSKKGWSVPVTLANSGVTAGTYGPSANVTGNNNATISVPEITVDAKGRVTSVVNRTLTCKNNTYTVNNATLTIQKNGTTVKTFTANASANVTANITVPTKVSELTNDSGFLTSHQSLSNYVTLNGAQTISGAKTFTGDVIGINKHNSTEDANSLYSTTTGSKLTYYTISNGGTTLTNIPAAVSTTLESRTIRRLSDSDWVVEQICHNNNGLYYRKGINGTWGAWKTFAFTDSNISGNAATATTATTAKACTGNAATATKLAAKRTIALSGAATGTATGFDGSGNITIPVTSLDASKLTGTASVSLVPAGVIIPFAGTSVPTGYLLCNGAAVSRTNYANLFAAIGTLYGAGNGSTTFNLPDARDRVLQGASGGHSAGSYIAAGLPNITGSMQPMYWSSASSTGAMNGWANKSNVDGVVGDAMGQVTVTFNASRSSSYYGASTKPQVDAIATNFIIKY